MPFPHVEGSRILACGLGRGRLCLPPAGIHYRPVRLPPYQFKNKEHSQECSLFLVEMRGVEPLSENRSMRLSPGASPDQISLGTTSDARSDTGSHFLRDRLNGEPPMHGHRYMTFSLGSRYSRGERAALLAAALPIRQPEQLDCCRLIFKVGHFDGITRPGPLIALHNPRRNRYTPELR